MTLETQRGQLMRCDRCSSCKWVPGMPSEAFASICPSIEYGAFHSYSGGGKVITAYGVLEGRFKVYSPEMLRSIYACSACGACDTACKWSHADAVEPLEAIYALRERVVTDGAILPAHRAALDALRAEGNRHGKPAGERSKWAEGLGLKDAIADRTPVLLHIGSDNAYTPSQWPELRAIAAALITASVDFGILGNDEPDDGGYAFDIGSRADAEHHAQQTTRAIARSGARRVITCSASAYWTFRNIYPRLGIDLIDITVEHAVQTIAALAESGTFVPPQAGTARTITYHDSCKLGRLAEPYPRWNGRWAKVMNQINVTQPERPVAFGNHAVHDAPRILLDRTGATRVEMQRNRQFGYCCGALGGGKEAEPDFADHAGRKRLEEACASGAEVLVSACGACTAHLREVAARHDMAITVEGLFEFVVGTSTAVTEQAV